MSSLNDSLLSEPPNNFNLTPEQEDTATLLERLLGKSISDRYIDFCRLSSGSFALRVAVPLTAHALRELDSILRQTLSIPLQVVKSPTEGEEARFSAASNALRAMGFGGEEIERSVEALFPRVNHKDQIRKIASQLGLAEDGDVARAWIAISSAHKKAHERPFNRTLEIDDDFRKEWAEPFHMVIRSIAIALQSRYAALIARVDELAAMADRARAVVLFEREIPGAMPLQWRFFMTINGPSWLPELINRKLIAEPPYSAEETKDQLMRQWPVGRYLVEMAKSTDAATRALVIYALRPLAKSTHPDVRRDALEIVAELLPKEAAGVADLVCQWLVSGSPIFGTHFVENIMTRLAEAGERDSCSTVARGLYGLSSSNNRIVTLFTPHMYEHSIFKMTPILSRALGVDALTLFCDLLYEAAVITDKIEIEPPRDHTALWPMPLPNTEADQHDVYGALCAAVMRCSIQLLEQNTERAEVITTTLLHRPYLIYQRITLNALARKPDAAPFVADALLLDPNLLASSYTRREYAALAERRFPSMTAAKQKDLLELIDMVPAKYVDIWRARHTEYYKREPNEEEERDYVSEMLRDLTWYWRSVLPADRQTTLQEFVSARGDPDAWRNTLRTPDDESPLNPADFSEADIQKITEYLRNWTPGAGPKQQTKTALAYELRKAVLQDPKKFSEGAGAFAELPPLYVRRLLEGLHQAAQNKAAIEPLGSLDLIEAVLMSVDAPAPHPQSEDGDDPSPFWAAKEAAELLRTILQRGNEVIGYEQADRIRLIIEHVEKIAPDTPELADFEDRYSQNPYFGAQTTMFGLVAELHVLFIYWLSKQTGSPVSANERQAISLTPSFVQFAHKALSHQAHNGRIVRAVFGRYLSWLIYFGEEWVGKHFEKIFAQEQPLRQASWLGHLLNDNRPARNFVEKMRPLYEDEIVRLMSERSDKESEYREDRCGEYLTILYLWGVLPPDLHASFLVNASDRLRRHVMWFVVRELALPHFPKDARERAKAYLEARIVAGLSASNKNEYRDELGAIGNWNATSADYDWLLSQQIKVFTAGFAPENAFSIIEQGAKLVSSHPDRTVEMMEALVFNPKTDRWAYMNSESMRTILRAGLASSSMDTHNRVNNIVSYLASIGETGFLDLIKR